VTSNANANRDRKKKDKDTNKTDGSFSLLGGH
jgi:hypothetical protein